MVPTLTLPSWLTKYAIVTYILALVAVSFIYASYALPWYYMLSGVVSVLVFFWYGHQLSKQLSIARLGKSKTFEQRIFLVAFLPRLLWMFLIYGLFMRHYGDAFGFENADANFYHSLGTDFAEAIRNWRFFEAWRDNAVYVDISDMGYAAYVGFVYSLTGDSIIVLRLLKCVWSALTVVLIYRLALRNFGPQIARIAALFCALWPNFWFYCGVHLKETEMVFLVVLFVEQADQMLRSREFTIWKIGPVVLIAGLLFTFRTPLALVSLLALLFAVVMSSARMVTWTKRISVGILAILLIAVTMGTRIEEQSRMLLQASETSGNMEWRAQREHGNAYAKYAGKFVFAPMIFTIPFPTMAKPFEGQDIQMLLNGGNYIKNILSYFTILAMFSLLLTGSWRQHALPLGLMLGYLVVLTMSSFPHSERFHQPVMAFELMFAAYGLTVALTNKRYKRWFYYWCAIMFVAAVAWNWFKLAGRGLA